MAQSPAADQNPQARAMHDQARQIFQQALSSATIERAFQRHVHCERGILRVCEDLYDLHSYGRILVISIGKAGHSMARALEARVGSSLEGIVASPTMPESQVHGFRYFCGGHPTPSAESIRAAEAILKSVSSQNVSSLVLFLLSGGGSSIAQKPIDEEIRLLDLVATYRAPVP